MFRILHFLALFGYLNILCFEVRSSDIFGFLPVEASETLVEVVLEEVLDLEQHQSAEVLPTIFFDDYRTDVVLLDLIPLVLLITWLFTGLIIESKKTTSNRFYLSRSICRPGYYSFLYRYRPF